MKGTTDQAPHRDRWQLISAVLCFCFGIALTLNIHPVGDGMWFWYADLERHGTLLYSTLRLPLQPLFILLTAASQDIFGLSWLGSKILAVFQLAAFCYGLLLLARALPWNDGRRALLIPAAFGLSLAPIYARFDDYHVTGYCFTLFSIVLLLRLRDEVRTRSILIGAALLGLLAGLSVANRLNDGAALAAASGISLCIVARRSKLVASLCFLVLTGSTFLLLILLTHDSLHNWWMRTVVLAAAIKGGTGNIFLAPFKLPVRMVQLLATKAVFADLTAEIFFVASCLYLNAHPMPARLRMRDRSSILAVVTATLSLALLLQQTRAAHPEEAVTVVGVLVSLALALLVLYRITRALLLPVVKPFRTPEVLLFFPALQLVSGAMTSGISVLEAFWPIALLLMLLPISFPEPFRRTMLRDAYLLLATALILCSVVYKTRVPYFWHHFSDRTLFVDRQWYKHPVYGELYLERDQLAFMRQVCADIHSDGPTNELLSLQNPYPNYFCNVAPWHNYVQTWYDTTSQQTIDTLDAELTTAPPKWIVYQRALDSMKDHEIVFTGGRPLPHRALDRLIIRQIDEGKWTVVRRTCFKGADWIVLRTSPPPLASVTSSPYQSAGIDPLCNLKSIK